MVVKEQVQQVNTWKRLKEDISISAVTAGLIATMVSYAGPLLIILQAAKVANLSDGLLSSWIWAVSFGSGLTCILLSIWFKTPVITAFSTPGAVLLVSSFEHYSFSDSIGAFLLSAVMISILGFTGLFSKIMNRIPQSITTAMLAGILLKFGVDVFVSLKQSPLMVIPMFICFLLARRWLPRYAVILTLVVGLAMALGFHHLNFGNVHMSLVKPIFTAPTFSLNALVGLGIPLCIVNMTSQNAPGIGVLRADGYKTPASPLVATTGIASILSAPFGSHGITLAAITAAICTGKEAHNNLNKRYIAGISCGTFYLLFGIFGAAITSVFSALPNELITVIAGVALFASLSSSLSSALSVTTQRDSALITFLVTVSGFSVAGVGSAFWGLIAGVIANLILTGNVRRFFAKKHIESPVSTSVND
ncbi:benzoate/H(+) symporter BenE family transporter [Bacillus sp. BRMEA1]|uniref:benzoate/H(+) symporter BenE family transporter n=1 Tax=Neobacillus endophyticus TaxID=2738405 RepID=UPI001562EAC2|nr:benzoate/H(+) symporter BenE family transporter [Neobacillus endophyticus]NRD77054.1 benzoate/H(+) symporter BenE family transporter [Neobacillus endophyticus]